MGGGQKGEQRSRWSSGKQEDTGGAGVWGGCGLSREVVVRDRRETEELGA